MRIVLLSDTPTYNGIGYTRYVGPYVVANHLESAGYDTVVVDWFTWHPDPIGLIREFLTSDTVAVGISTTMLASQAAPDQTSITRNVRYDNYYNAHLWFNTRNGAREWLALLRSEMDRVCPDAVIILGGAKGSEFAKYREDILETTYEHIDVVMTGTADFGIVHLIEDIRAGRTPFGKTRGGIRFVDAGIGENKQCPKLDWQHKWALQPNEGIPIEIARGCLYNCKFCHFEKRFSNVKPVQHLKDELTRNYELFGIQTYHFTDDCFNDRRDKVESVCSAISSLPFKIEWVSYARADLAIKFPDTLAAMVESGCRGVFYGIETFNHKAGRAAGKGVPPDKVKQFLLDTRARYLNDLIVDCSFIVGLPYETEQTQLDTFAWMDQHRPCDISVFGALNLHVYSDEMDGTVMDYADYSRNPAKYGFEEIRFDPLYWRHGTMDSIRANEMARQGELMWWGSDHLRYRRLVHSIWAYPLLRGLGYSKEEVFTLARTHDGEDFAAKKELRRRRQNQLDRYWSDLIERNQK